MMTHRIGTATPRLSHRSDELEIIDAMHEVGRSFGSNEANIGDPTTPFHSFR